MTTNIARRTSVNTKITASPKVSGVAKPISTSVTGTIAATAIISKVTPR